MGHPVRLRALLSALLLCAAPAAHGFALRTAFTDPCHESLALYAWSRYLVDLPLDGVPVPGDGPWRAVADDLARTYELQPQSDAERLVLVSLLLGVRFPDSEGHALTDLENIRVVHAAPDAQAPHTLRHPSDDGPEGDARALAAARAFIRSQVEEARTRLQRPGPEQLLTVQAVLDHYGPVPVQAWAPAFHLGQALHAVQDSFAHSLRDAENQRVFHVMNYVEAINGTLLESRDGLPHSQTMDTCGVGNASVVQAAADASLDFVVAALGDELLEGRPGAVDVVLERWMSPAAATCTRENAYCDAPWLGFASQDFTRPYLSRAFGCSSAGGGAALAGVLAFFGLLGRRAPRSRRLARTSATLLGLLPLLHAPGAAAQERPATVGEVLESTGLAPRRSVPEAPRASGCAPVADGRYVPSPALNVEGTPSEAVAARCPGARLEVDVRTAASLVVDRGAVAALDGTLRTRFRLIFPASCSAGVNRCTALPAEFSLGDVSCRPSRGGCLCVQRALETWRPVAGARFPVQACAGDGAPGAAWRLRVEAGEVRWTERWTQP
jgi:hypothetical protein